jgi:hypothetical protein
MVKYLGNEWLSGIEVNVYGCAYHEWNQIQLLQKVRICFRGLLRQDIEYRYHIESHRHAGVSQSDSNGDVIFPTYFAQVERSPKTL